MSHSEREAAAGCNKLPVFTGSKAARSRNHISQPSHKKNAAITSADVKDSFSAERGHFFNSFGISPFVSACCAAQRVDGEYHATFAANVQGVNAQVLNEVVHPLPHNSRFQCFPSIHFKPQPAAAAVQTSRCKMVGFTSC